ncbi:TIM barrel protein [Frigidibacter sp. MR17.14]|uniref:sugar phosphate isomerase/epimerase family protein n=1 Tax=Frigidibacter sp. MR17.14 TaxID=3126509 RepID=UPI003012B0EF
MTPLSLAHLTAIDLPPPALIEAAARAGFQSVGLRLVRVTAESPGYPLMEDAGAMRATRAALAATGITVSDIEFLKITPETEVAALLPVLDAGAALDAAQVITAPYDPDLSRLSDRLAALSDAAAERGLGTVLEFFPWTSVPDLDTCLRVVEAAGPRMGMLVDSLHFDRSGSSLARLAAVDPARLPFAHLCDAPVAPPYTTEQLLFTAREGRQIPGEGQIDLLSFLRALPRGLPLGLEVPGLPGYAAADPLPALTRLVTQTRALLAQV